VAAGAATTQNPDNEIGTKARTKAIPKWFPARARDGILRLAEQILSSVRQGIGLSLPDEGCIKLATCSDLVAERRIHAAAAREL